MRRTQASLIFLVAATALAIPAYAFKDKATGFSVNPPAGFVASPSSHRKHDAAVVVNSSSGKPVATNSDKNLCKIAYKNSPKNNRFTRAQINALVVTPARKNLLKNAFGRVFTLSHTSQFTHQQYEAFEFHGAPKFGPNHENVRMFISIIETRKGRASMICATSVNDFASGLKAFRAIRASMNVPG